MSGFKAGGVTFRKKTSTAPADTDYISIFNLNGVLHTIDEDGTITPLTPTIEPGLSLGITSANAFYGDKGNIAYIHSQTLGNVHNVSASQIPSTLSPYNTSVEILGRTYQTVIMPDGKEWLTESFKYDELGSWYNDAQFDDGYGRYYSSSDRAIIEGILPDGWRHPSKQDFIDMLTATTGDVHGNYGVLFSQEVGGTDEYGFNLKYAPFYNYGAWTNLESMIFLSRTIGVDDGQDPAWVFTDGGGSYMNWGDEADPKMLMRLVREPVVKTSSTVQEDINVLYSKTQGIGVIDSKYSLITSTLTNDITVLSGAIDDINDKFPLSASEILSTNQISETVIFGKTYQTIIMPDGKEWMAENLDYDGFGAIDGEISKAYDPVNIINIVEFPDGWHLPSTNEWQNLHYSAQLLGYDGNAFKTSGTTDWKPPSAGTNVLGFNAKANFYDREYEFWMLGNDYTRMARIVYNSGMWFYDAVKFPNQDYMSIRLVRDISPSNVQRDIDYLIENKADKSTILTLGTTSADAFRGDLGQSAYEHSITGGNPHGTAISDIPGLTATLGNLAPTSTVVDLTSTQVIGGSKTFSNYIYLGENGPGIKTMMVRGTTSTVQGGSTFLPTGVPLEQVVSVGCIVYASNEGYVPNTVEGFSGVQYSLCVLENQVQVRTSSTNSINILEKEVKVFITYSLA